MSALLPTVQAQRLREGLSDYLTTTFALTDPDARLALEEFLADPHNGLFKGPFVRLRMPFKEAIGNWRESLDWYEGFVPYGHQALAFERLSTKSQSRPRPTLVTTGTGSGKTEAFLMPIIDHVLRAKRDGVTGMKALILYPMNALANDQAKRLTALLTEHDELSGITAGIYTGQAGPQRTQVSAAGLISDRRIMRDSPPDILLTNYKMLDQLLLRQSDAQMWEQSATSLQYLVLDEFHTYDGAQGTDVAMLLRRLGLTLKSYWADDDSAVTAADRDRPLGKVTPVATSATLGSKDDPAAMLRFGTTVFGEIFDTDAVITESRLTIDEWMARRGRVDTAYEPVERPNLASAVGLIDKELEAAAPQGRTSALVTAVLRQLYVRADRDALSIRDLTILAREENLLDVVARHPLTRSILEHATSAISLDDLGDLVFAGDETTFRSEVNRKRHQRAFLTDYFALLSHVRVVNDLAAPNVDVHLWVRELSRVDKLVATNAIYRWADDGLNDTEEMYLPAIYCRHCGRSGWGISLAPTGNTLDVKDDTIRADHARGTSRFRALIFAPAEADYLKALENEPGDQTAAIPGLAWFHAVNRELAHSRPRDDDPDHVQGRILPVLTLYGEDADQASHDDRCPACLTDDGIRFLGAAIATLLSVTLSGLFGDNSLDSDEKKALMFTDSVQDAAHRAAFVQARSHTLSLRSALRNSVSSNELSLDELAASAIEDAGDNPVRRYQLMPPEFVDRVQFAPFWDAAADKKARLRATAMTKRRLSFDIAMEFGLQSRLGRTLELTGSVVAEVNAGSPARLLKLAHAAMDLVHEKQPTLLLAPNADKDEAILQWVRGSLERIRTQGGIYHEWFKTYITSDGNRRSIWFARPRGQGMPAFPTGRPAPAYPRVGGSRGNSKGAESFDNVTSAKGWYAHWASRCLNVSAADGAFLAVALMERLAEDRVLDSLNTDSGATVYFVKPDLVKLTAPKDDDLETGRHFVACQICQALTAGTATVIDQLEGAPCLAGRCLGTLTRKGRDTNFYRDLYASSDMKRVVAREHTSMLEDSVRLQYETAFKSSVPHPQTPNVLVATPTLELGIDIGDLSTVMLASLPNSVSSYLQRVGRAGRLTGNSLVLAYVKGRGQHLPKLYDPLSVIDGQVRPPATFLDAEEILQRQYVAHMVDRFARTPGEVEPRSAVEALGSFEPGSWMARLIDEAESNAAAHLDNFLEQFGDQLRETSVDALRLWASSVSDGSSGLVLHLQRSVHQWCADVEELVWRRKEINEALPELEEKVNSPAVTDEDKSALRTAHGSIRLIGKQLSELTGEYWIKVLEQYGVLPNYTLLDDTVRLDVGVTWVDQETGDYVDQQVAYDRDAGIALTEFAPGATFYAQGLAVQIDSVDLGPGLSNIRPWRLCPACGWVAFADVGGDVPAINNCERCGSAAISDVAQRLDVVEMKQVSAEVRRDEAAISDGRDERIKERFSLVLAADIDPASVAERWYVADSHFGADYLRQVTLRWLNVGKQTANAPTRSIAGNDLNAGLFRVCAHCGHLDQNTHGNSVYEHRSWCRHRKAVLEEVREVALARILSTQGVLLHIPPELTLDRFGVPSLAAAVLLGLREVIGGSPDHLAIEAIPDVATGDGVLALLLHDTVPGGTGYLADFADPERVWDVLFRAWEVLRSCPCQDEERLACHRCLLPFVRPSALDTVARSTAAKTIEAMLWGSAPPKEGELPEYVHWTVAEGQEPPKGAQLESMLEVYFRSEFVKRLTEMGMAVSEKPGTHGNTVHFTVPGSPIRKWTLRPQVLVGGTKPDFILETQDPDVPSVAIYTDGMKYHATSAINRLADDAVKRDELRQAGFMVWSVTWADIERFATKAQVRPSWFEAQMAEGLMKNFKLKPKLLQLLNQDPVSQLLEWLRDPDVDAWRNLGRAMPFLLSRPNALKKSNSGSALEAAFARLNGEEEFTGPGPDQCWTYAAGSMVLTACALGFHEGVKRCVLAIDDRDAALDADVTGDAWKSWLGLSNLLGLYPENVVITTYSRIASGEDVTRAPVTPTTEVASRLPAAWQALWDQSFADDEKELLVALAERSAPLPELGHETAEGLLVDVAWVDARVAVVWSTDPEDLAELAKAGWVVCPPDPDAVMAALTTAGDD